MDEKIVRIEFNIWASSEEEGAQLRQSIVDFINEHGREGRKVTAAKVAQAIANWKANSFVKSKIINYFK